MSSLSMKFRNDAFLFRFLQGGANAGASVLTAPLGVYLAHSLPVDKLKRLFAGLLLVVATRMLISLF